jgi:hypothetical protein
VNELILKGIDGANPLGFLAAVGVLRTASMAWSTDYPTTMEWRKHDGAWRPVLSFHFYVAEADFVSKLNITLKQMQNHPAFKFSDNLSLSPEVFRNEVLKAQKESHLNDRRFADFMAAYGCESLCDKNSESIADTAMRTMSGAGHQHFLGTIRQIVSDTEVFHISKTLFSLWQYDDPVEKHTMRWDPADDVRYALQWQNPSGDRNRKVAGCVWGANRLAIEALPLFVTAPKINSLETTAFTQNRAKGIFLTWPIWESPLSIETLRSLLSLHELQTSKPDRNKLKKIGVVEIFRCQRLTQGKFRNFSTAVPL